MRHLGIMSAYTRHSFRDTASDVPFERHLVGIPPCAVPSAAGLCYEVRWVVVDGRLAVAVAVAAIVRQHASRLAV